MPFLSFVSDEALQQAVDHLLTVAVDAMNVAEGEFNKNVVDPFAALFEMSGFGLEVNAWRSIEKMRKAQKTLSNHVGGFHQALLGHVNGWHNLGTGGIVDLVSTEHRVVAEIKNKFNTVKGSDLIHVYNDLENLVMPKNSLYKDFTAYYVTIIPKKPGRLNQAFMPSDKSMGKRKPENALIRMIDGYSFYELVTGEAKALEKLFHVLPAVIHQSTKVNHISETAQAFLKHTFAAAFLGN